MLITLRICPPKVIHQDTTAGEVFLQAKRIQK